MKEIEVRCNCISGMNMEYDRWSKAMVKSVCKSCHGTGWTKKRIYPHEAPCGNCKGTGKVAYPTIIGGPDTIHTCPDCRGRKTEMVYDD